MNLQLLIAGDNVPDLELAGLCEHTGEVWPGFAFIAVAANDELFDAHCEAAVSAGAVVILCAPHPPFVQSTLTFLLCRLSMWQHVAVNWRPHFMATRVPVSCVLA